MTQNQIAYQNMLETIKHNRVSESELGRHNLATEGETSRHNVVTEGQEAQSLTELNRHNKAVEHETKRSNVAALRETKRANKAREKENRRSNKASEANTRRGQDINYQAKIQELQNQLTIARESNASKERIAELQAQINKYTAQLNASTNKAIAWINSDTEVFKKKMDQAISSDKNASQESIAAAQNYTKEIIATADRIQRYAAQTDTNNLKKQELRLQSLRDQVDKDYKSGLLDVEQAKLLQKQIDNINKALDTAGTPSAMGTGGSATSTPTLPMK